MASINPLDNPIYNGRTLREIFAEKRRLGQFQALRGDAKWQALKKAAERAGRATNESPQDTETPPQ